MSVSQTFNSHCWIKRCDKWRYNLRFITFEGCDSMSIGNSFQLGCFYMVCWKLRFFFPLTCVASFFYLVFFSLLLSYNTRDTFLKSRCLRLLLVWWSLQWHGGGNRLREVTRFRVIRRNRCFDSIYTMCRWWNFSHLRVVFDIRANNNRCDFTHCSVSVSPAAIQNFNSELNVIIVKFIRRRCVLEAKGVNMRKRLQRLARLLFLIRKRENCDEGNMHVYVIYTYLGRKRTYVCIFDISYYKVLNSTMPQRTQRAIIYDTYCRRTFIFFLFCFVGCALPQAPVSQRQVKNKNFYYFGDIEMKKWTCECTTSIIFGASIYCCDMCDLSSPYGVRRVSF